MAGLIADTHCITYARIRVLGGAAFPYQVDRKRCTEYRRTPIAGGSYKTRNEALRRIEQNGDVLIKRWIDGEAHHLVAGHEDCPFSPR